MEMIEASVELLTPFDGDNILKFIEGCGRVCYRSEGNITADSAAKFVKMIINRGHESVLEHFSCTFKIVCDRGVMAELTRHRLASFSIESTRYCDYSADKFGGELNFINPHFWNDGEARQNFLENAMIEAEEKYLRMRMAGCKPEQARAVLPLSLATTVIMTTNLREWRHILKLRTDKKAHPQMRQIAGMILDIFKDKLPAVFEDIVNG